MNLANFYESSKHTDTPPAGTGGGGAERPAGEQTPEQVAQEAEHKAARLFDTMPQGEKKPGEAPKTEADRAATLYSPDSTYGDTTLITEVPAGATAEAVQQANTETRQEFAKLELPGTLARELTGRFTAAMKTPLSDAEYDARVSSFKTDLAARFGGAEHVEERLADVQKLLAKAHPAVTTALVESGLNFDVDTIAALAGHARSLRGRGRL